MIIDARKNISKPCASVRWSWPLCFESRQSVVDVNDPNRLSPSVFEFRIAPNIRPAQSKPKQVQNG
jgi:hypothetical protein